MILVTTLSYDQFGELINNNQVSLDNSDLIFGQDYEPIKTYMQEHLGSQGYVLGIRGRINKQSVKLLSMLDQDIRNNRIILEINVDDNDVLTFDVKGLEEAAQIMAYGLPDEMVYDQLDNSLMPKDKSSGIQVVCTPVLRRTNDIRITSLGREVILDIEGITFVKLK